VSNVLLVHAVGKGVSSHESHLSVAQIALPMFLSRCQRILDTYTSSCSPATMAANACTGHAADLSPVALRGDPVRDLASSTLQTLNALWLLPAVVDAALPRRDSLDLLLQHVRSAPQNFGASANSEGQRGHEQTHLLLVYHSVCECARVGDAVIREAAAAVLRAVGSMLLLDPSCRDG
jgi:hypothetical protein